MALVGKGCTGACNAVNTTLTTDAQLQKQGERLLGALGLAEKLRSPAAHCLKASPFICWVQPRAWAYFLFLARLSTQQVGPGLFHCGALLAFIGSKVIGLSIQPSCLMYPLSACTNTHVQRGRRELVFLGGHTGVRWLRASWLIFSYTGLCLHK